MQLTIHSGVFTFFHDALHLRLPNSSSRREEQRVPFAFVFFSQGLESLREKKKQLK